MILFIPALPSLQRYRSVKIKDINSMESRTNLKENKKDEEFRLESSNPNFQKDILVLYKEEQVKKWKKMYEIYGNLSRVSREYKKYINKQVPENTIKRKLKELLAEEFPNWYKKYRLMGKYSWEEAKYWKELYEELHNFPKVEEYIKKNINPNGPHEDTIRRIIKKYFTQILLRDYDIWIKEFHEDTPYKYNNEDYLNWKELYEKLGTLRDVREQLIDEDHLSPAPITIRKGLRKILGEKYESWKAEYTKQYFSDEDILEWKRLYEKYGSIGKVSEISTTDPKIIKKHLKTLIGKDYDTWYKRYYQHHSLKYSDRDVAEWKSLFEELGSFPAVSFEINSTLAIPINPSVIRKRINQFLEEKGLNYNDWLNKYSLSENIVDIGKKIHQIIEYYFMLNFKDTNVLTFYEISPSRESDDLFRVDNSIIDSHLEGVGNISMRVINIDYLFSSNPERVYPKMYKNYHGKEMFLLIIILTNRIDSYSIPLDVSFKDNIKIIHIDEFFKIFVFKEGIKEKIQDAIFLAKRAPYNPKDYTSLKKIAKSLNKQIKLEFGNRKTQQISYNKIISKIQD